MSPGLFLFLTHFPQPWGLCLKTCAHWIPQVFKMEIEHIGSEDPKWVWRPQSWLLESLSLWVEYLTYIWILWTQSLLSIILSQLISWWGRAKDGQMCITHSGLKCLVWKGVMNVICCVVWLWEVPFTLWFVNVASQNQTWPWLGCHQIYATWKPLQTKAWLLLRNNLARWKEADGCVHRTEKRRIKSSKRMHSRLSCL